MADEADLAEVNVQSRMEEYLAANAKALRPETHPDFDGKHCVECDVGIPPERLAMGKVRCTHCQSTLEYKRRLSA